MAVELLSVDVVKFQRVFDNPMAKYLVLGETFADVGELLAVPNLALQQLSTRVSLFSNILIPMRTRPGPDRKSQFWRWLNLQLSAV
jgi:hypothetical protein